MCGMEWERETRMVRRECSRKGKWVTENDKQRKDKIGCFFIKI